MTKSKIYRCYLVVTLSMIYLISSGCTSDSSKPVEEGIQDKEIVSKRIVGVWKTRMVSERDGKPNKIRYGYYIFRKPNDEGEGVRLFAFESNDKIKSWDQVTDYKISKTFDDGKLIKFNRIVSGEVIGHDTFEVIQEPNYSAVVTTDKREYNKKHTEVLARSAGRPDFDKRDYQRVLDPIELMEIEDVINPKPEN